MFEMLDRYSCFIFTSRFNQQKILNIILQHMQQQMLSVWTEFLGCAVLSPWLLTLQCCLACETVGCVSFTAVTLRLLPFLRNPVNVLISAKCLLWSNSTLLQGEASHLASGGSWETLLPPWGGASCLSPSLHSPRFSLALLLFHLLGFPPLLDLPGKMKTFLLQKG